MSDELHELLDTELEFSPKELLIVLDLISINPQAQALLAHDKCCRLVDNYLLALIFVYFKRANLKCTEVTEVFFFAALLLAHDLYEEDDQVVEDIKYFIIPPEEDDLALRRQVANIKFLLFKEMGFRGCVSRSTCEKVMSAVPHPLWERQRDAYHGGTTHEISVPEEVSASQYDWYASSCKYCREASLRLKNKRKIVKK